MFFDYKFFNKKHSVQNIFFDYKFFPVQVLQNMFFQKAKFTKHFFTKQIHKYHDFPVTLGLFSQAFIAIRHSVVSLIITLLLYTERNVFVCGSLMTVRSLFLLILQSYLISISVEWS